MEKYKIIGVNDYGRATNVFMGVIAARNKYDALNKASEKLSMPSLSNSGRYAAIPVTDEEIRKSIKIVKRKLRLWTELI